MTPHPRLTDLHPSDDDIAGDVLRGLASTPKRLPSKYFYDQRGSELFEAITRQPEYYPTRIELAMLADHGQAIARAVDAIALQTARSVYTLRRGMHWRFWRRGEFLEAAH